MTLILKLCVACASGRSFEGPGGESEMDRRQRELYVKQQQLLREQRAADQERLLTAISGMVLVGIGTVVACIGCAKP